MIIYRADFFISEDYDQKEFLKNLEKNFKSFDDGLFTNYDYDDVYNSCIMFDSIDDALDELESRNAVGARISQFNLDENQCKELLISGNLKVIPDKILYYSYNETTEELDEFQLKAFL